MRISHITVALAAAFTLAISTAYASTVKTVTAKGEGSTAQEAKENAIHRLDSDLQEIIRREFGDSVLARHSAELQGALRQGSRPQWLTVNFGQARESGGSTATGVARNVARKIPIRNSVVNAIKNEVVNTPTPKKYTVDARAQLRLDRLKIEVERVTTPNVPPNRNLVPVPSQQDTPSVGQTSSGTAQELAMATFNRAVYQSSLSSVEHSKECVASLLKNREDGTLYYFNTIYCDSSGHPGTSIDAYIDNNNIAHLPRKNIKVDNVRSVHVARTHDSRTYFFLKHNNELWAMGNNRYGHVGDNTGMDRASPVFVMGDVANIYVGNHLGNSYTIQAQKTDKSIWIWGRGNKESIYAPTNVKAFSGADHSYYEPHIMNQRLFREHILARSFNNLNHTMIELPDDITNLLGGANNVVASVMADNREYPPNKRGRFYALTKDGILWGWGRNDGDLGDGIRSHRDRPVKIAENVKRIFPEGFVANDNDWYLYSDEGHRSGILKAGDKPFTPGLILIDCIYAFGDSSVERRWFTLDGKLVVYEGSFSYLLPGQTKLYYMKQGVNRLLGNETYIKKTTVAIDDIKLPSIVRAEGSATPKAQPKAQTQQTKSEQPKQQGAQSPVAQPVQQQKARTGAPISQADFMAAILAREKYYEIRYPGGNLTQLQQQKSAENIKQAEKEWEEGLYAAIGTGIVNDWVGEIEDVGSDFITVKLHDEAFLTTKAEHISFSIGGDRSVRIPSDRRWKSIDKTMPFYDLLLSLNKQDVVIFSGHFFQHDGCYFMSGSGIVDKSEKKRGWITKWEFVFEFTALRKQ